MILQLPQLLTNSRMQAAKDCLRKHYFAYELGIRKNDPSTPLRFGDHFHNGLDWLAQGVHIDDVCHRIRARYADVPLWCDDDDKLREWTGECERCVRLLCDYQWRWSEDTTINRIVATEQAFSLPLLNPSTKGQSRRFRFAGKIDKVVELSDGRLALMEHKTTSDSITPESDYWRRLRLDSQISGYMVGARALGYDVQTVVYDVIAKPAIRPRDKVAETDDKGRKIVVDEDGDRCFNSRTGEPLNTADAKKGRRFMYRPESIDEYGQRLTDMIVDDPDRFYQRRIIPRLESDLDDYRHELWQQQQAIGEMQKHGRWYRNTAVCMKPYRCHYFDICANGIKPEDAAPVGYTKLENVHPELADTKEHDHADCTAADEATTGTTEDATTTATSDNTANTVV